MRFIRATLVGLGLLVIFQIVPILSLAQQSWSRPDLEYAWYNEKYFNEPAIYLIRKQNITYQLVNDSIVTTINVYEEILHLGENTTRYAINKVFSSDFNEVTEIVAYTLVPQKKKYEQIDVKEFKKSFDTGSDVFYDDSREISFTYPSVQKGCKTVLQYKRKIKDPRMIGLFRFDTYMPVHQASVTVEYEPNIEIAPHFTNKEKFLISEKKTKLQDGKSIYSAEAQNIEKIEFERNCPSYAYLSSSIYCPVKEFIDSQGKIHQVISTPEALHSWYRTFVREILTRDAEVEQFVNDIVDKNDPDIEKINKVYKWVQSNIKYIAFEDGMRGLIPHPAKYVINQRYGDCKDMTSAIVGMLRELGIEAYYTWIGTRELPYLYSHIASPITDNHMIATVFLDNEPYFLDATAQYLPFGLPSSSIQGKECIISLNETEFIIAKVPVIEKQQNEMSDTVSVRLDNGILKGIGKVDLSGYARYFNALKLNKTSKKNVDDYLKRLLSKGNNKFLLDEYEIMNLEDVYNPIRLNYTFSISDYYKQVQDNIYINLVLDRTMSDALLQNRKVAIENDYKYINRSVINLEIPDGYEVSSLPDSINKNSQNFGFSINYTANTGQISLVREFYVDYLIMYPEDFIEWDQLISEYANASRKVIILKKAVK